MRSRFVPALCSSVLGAGLLAMPAGAAPAAKTAATAPASAGVSRFVSPLIGTGAHGHTYPGATVPFGMVQLSPDTRTGSWDGSSGYHYSDSTILGFSHTHLSGTGVGGLGDVLLMPTVGDVRLDAGKPGDGYASRFSHRREVAAPGYYRVFLEDPQVTAELTATPRCGFHRYTFPSSAGNKAHVVLDLAHGVGCSPVDLNLHVENATTVSGMRVSNGWGGRRTLYFVLQFSRPFTGRHVEQGGQAADGADAAGRSVKAAFDFDAAGGPVLVKVGISATGVEGAKKNLAAEIPGWDFDAVHAAATKQWDAALGAATVETADAHVRTTFYTALYHAFMAPTLYDDVDGAYRGLDHQVHPGGGSHNYTTFSLWDTYRAEAPLLTILQPGRVGDMVQSMFAEYQQNGLHTMPVWPLWENETWCMIGYHSAPVVADAYLKGFRGFDAEAVYQALKDTALQDRNGLKTYKTLGYVVSSPGQAATSKTLEYSVDDACIARMAAALGHTDDARLFFERSKNYRNLFDRTTQFMRGRRADGAWRMPFVSNALVGDEYTESDAWQYAFAVQHDVRGMIDLYGGDAGFVRKLDALFAADPYIQTNIPDISGRIGQYAQGNEPCHHIAYLYSYAGQPWKTQERVRQVLASQYSDQPDGLCGNDDCGQMSAWYALSALGFYPVDPAGGTYVLGSPAVSRATIALDKAHYGGRTFTLIAENNSATNVYIQSATLNGKPLNRTWFTHKELTAGGTLKLVMGPKPNTTWGAAVASRPPDGVPAGVKVAALPPPAPTHVDLPKGFPLRIVCGGDSADGFLPDPNMIEGATNGDGGARIVTEGVANAAPASVYQSERYGRDFSYRLPVPAGKSYTVRLHFAEIFDSEVGERIENVSINGKPALTDFDILAAAGGTVGRAVVREFASVTPDASGNIVIRVTAAPNSPDQNAKISGIEILEAGG